jgi:hypothetical protein
MNENGLHDAKMVVGIPKVHVFNTETFLVNPHTNCATTIGWIGTND